MKQPDSQPLRFRALFVALLLFLVGGFATCGSDGSTLNPEITVVVDVAGLTPDISSLFVTSSLNDGTPQSSPEITTRLDQFAIALPLTTSGHLTINVVGRSAERCVVASGKVEVDVLSPPTRYQVSVSLAATAANAVKSCTLTLNVLGKGTITSDPPGLSCAGIGKMSTPTSCSYDFPVGTTIKLTTTADPKIYGTTYSGLCTGATDCSLTFSGPGTVTAGIANRICSNNSWCWYNPLPQGNALRAIWGTAANDIWAVGDVGTILH